jgi:hypothetical protein
MSGIHVMIPTTSRPAAHPYTLPVLAGTGLAAATLAGSDWAGLTQRATAAIGLAGLVGGAVVGGIVYAITKFDQVAIERRKKYDDANKELLSEQLEGLMEQSKAAAERAAVDGAAMRASLHELRNEAQLAKAENYELRAELGTLRGQFMAVSKQLHETDLLLHAARAEMHGISVELKHTAEALATSERERQCLHEQIAGLRSGQQVQATRLDLLEYASEEDAPAPGGPPDPPIAPEGGP